MFENIKSVYIIGIGGISMSALAIMIKEKGIDVKGSDIKLSSLTENIEKMGIEVKEGDAPEYVFCSDMIVYTGAVSKENKDLKVVKQDELDYMDLIKLYDVFLEKIKNTIYNVRLSAQEKTLTEKRENFIKLSDEDKCAVLSEILHMFQCQSGSSDLRLIDGVGKAGILKIGNNVTNIKQITILNQSPTGIYQQEIDLKTV